MGSIYEARAAAFLEEKGLKILEKNFRCKSGEIDLIAREMESIVFVEVKYRSDHAAGSASEAVDIRKQIQISRTAEFYLYSKIHSLEVPCRFDVIAFEGEKLIWLKNAFDFCVNKKKRY